MNQILVEQLKSTDTAVTHMSYIYRCNILSCNIYNS